MKNRNYSVIPAKAGIQTDAESLDPRPRIAGVTQAITKNIHFVATGYVVKGEKTLLLLHRKLGLWLPPGGHIEEGETPDEAVLREVHEETGLRVKIMAPKLSPKAREKDVRFLYSPNHVQMESLPGHGGHIDLIYFCRVIGGREKISEKESLSMRWHDAQDLQSDSIRDEVRRVALLAIRHISRSQK